VTSFPDTFQSLFRTIALRHTKDALVDELKLPFQKRVIVTVPFTPIEEQHYGQMFQRMCDECGFSKEGGPLSGDINFHSTALIEKMRSWLVRLRQTCLHPEVGGMNRRALGQGDGPLRTVAEGNSSLSFRGLYSFHQSSKL
jgi:E3 ubiquitin-protein ligase SHPRH